MLAIVINSHLNSLEIETGKELLQPNWEDKSMRRDDLLTKLKSIVLFFDTNVIVVVQVPILSPDCCYWLFLSWILVIIVIARTNCIHLHILEIQVVRNDSNQTNPLCFSFKQMWLPWSYKFHVWEKVSMPWFYQTETLTVWRALPWPDKFCDKLANRGEQIWLPVTPPCKVFPITFFVFPARNIQFCFDIDRKSKITKRARKPSHLLRNRAGLSSYVKI